MNTPRPIRLRKAKWVLVKTLSFRDASVEDAVFIPSLRTYPEKSRHLSAVSGELVDQRAWLERYTRAHDQAYFIIEHQGEPVGTVRLYDPQARSFCWGSWILTNTRPSHAAMESALMVYAYAVDQLGFSAAHFDVREGGATNACGGSTNVSAQSAPPNPTATISTNWVAKQSPPPASVIGAFWKAASAWCSHEH